MELDHEQAMAFGKRHILSWTALGFYRGISLSFVRWEQNDHFVSRLERFHMPAAVEFRNATLPLACRLE